MAVLDYNYIIKYQAKVCLMGPLHIGGALEGEESVLSHPVTGQPFVQASSIAGVFRAYAVHNCEESFVESFFGNSLEEKNASRTRFSDGEFEEVSIELRPHVMIDRQTGTVASSKNSGQKFEMEYIGIGSVFVFICYLFLQRESCPAQGENQIEEQRKAFESIFSAMRRGELIFGAKKSNGAGRVQLVELNKKEFDCLTSEGLEDWLKENQDTTDAKLIPLEQLPEGHSTHIAYHVKVTGKTECAIQIKGIDASGFGIGVPNSENIRNAKGDYIIPGSSLKGAFRSQMEKIAGYLKKEDVIQAAFGTAADDDENQEGKKGNLFFTDTKIIADSGENRQMPGRYRIHIDKFTGGVFDKGLFYEKNAAGNLEISVEIEKDEASDKVLALFVMALRDLAIQTMNLGNGYASGKGFVKDVCITIQSWDNKSAGISFAEKPPVLKDNDKLLQNAFKKLKGGA